MSTRCGQLVGALIGTGLTLILLGGFILGRFW